MAVSPVPKNDHKTFHLAESSLAQYIIAIVLAASAYVGIIWYQSASEGIEGVRIFNRGASNLTVFLLGVVLLLGPMNRIFGGHVFHTLFMFRKELGMIAALTGIAHVYLSMFVVARSGPFGFYLAQPWSAYAGLTGLILLVSLFAISFAQIQRHIHPLLWWKMQYLGARSAFVAIIGHIVIIRWDDWGAWLGGHMSNSDISLPPLSLLSFIAALYIFCIRLVDRFGGKNKRMYASGFACLAAGILLGLFVV